MKPLPPSKALASRVLYAALISVKDAGGELKLREIKATVSSSIELDNWATSIIESNGLPRWEMYLHFFSIDAVKAGFLTKGRGNWAITDSGKAALELGEEGFFRQAQDGYRDWQGKQTPRETVDLKPSDAFPEVEKELPPEEGMEAILTTADQRLAAEILERLIAADPSFFERVVLETILKLGYGGSRHEAGQAIGKSGDEGIDGIINEDRLGLDTIYLQAKRWANPAGRPEIQKFVGALAGKQANKGIFITTSAFTAEAKDYASRIAQKVILINGAQLARLMIEHNVGVSTVATYELKRIDSDYFSDE